MIPYKIQFFKFHPIIGLFVTISALFIASLDFFCQITYFGKIIIHDTAFLPNKFVIMRPIVILSFAASIVISGFICSSKSKFKADIEKYLNTRLGISIVISLLIIILVHVVLVFTGRFQNLLNFLNSTILILILILIFDRLNKSELLINIVNNKALATFCILVLFGVGLSQLLTFRYVNLESIVDYELVSEKANDTARSVPNLELLRLQSDPNSQSTFSNAYYEGEVNDNEIFNQIKRNSLYAGITSIVPPTVYDNNKFVRVRVDGRNNVNLCLFSKYYDSCVKDSSKLSDAVLISKYIDDLYSSDLIRVTNGISQRNSFSDLREEEYQKTDNRKELLNYSSKRGIYGHHYHAFILGNFNEGLASLYTSQYGFGSSFLVKILQDYFDLSQFDSVYVGIFSANLILILIVTLVYYYNTSRNGILLVLLAFAYFVFLQCTNWYISPGLYPIRYMPILVLCILIGYYKYEDNRIRDGLLVFCYAISPFYNFEYGVLVTLSAASTFLLARNYRLFGLSLLPVIVSKIIGIFLSGNSYQETLNLYYINGIGFNPVISVYSVLLILIFIIISVGLIWRLGFSLSKSWTQHFLFIFFVLSLSKFLWSGGIAQGCLSFFIFGLYVISTLNLLESNNQRSFLYGSFVMYVSLVTALSTFHYMNTEFVGSKKFNIEYSESEFSKFVKLDSRIVNRLNDVKKLNVGNPINIISPIDSFYSLYFNRPILSPFPDLSTFLILQSDLNKAFKYIEANSECMLVEKILTEDPNKYLPLSNRYTEPYSSYNAANLMYMNNLKSLYDRIKKSNYFKTNESQYFINFCKK